MNADALKPACFEFRFPQLNTVVRVENTAEHVLIRATRDTFSEDRKTYFIRELAAEGFIPDGCRWYPLPGIMPQVRWVIDSSWRRVAEASAARTRRVLVSLLGGAVVIWTALLTGLLLTQSP